MVYLIHFEQKLKHAQHYIGFCADERLEDRMARHRSGNGAKILMAVTKAGISWRVVYVWEEGDRTFERSLKKKKNSKILCPICNKKHSDHKIFTNESQSQMSSEVQSVI